MGAWHHGPYENDSALDWLGVVEKPIHAGIAKALRIKKTPNCAGYHEAIAAAQLLVDLSDRKRRPNVAYESYNAGTYDVARTSVATILANESWISTWKSPRLVSAMLQTLAKDLKVAQARERKLAARVVKVFRHPPFKSRKRKAA